MRKKVQDVGRQVACLPALARSQLRLAEPQRLADAEAAEKAETK